MEKRNTNADIIRIFAFFMVLLVHTFLNNGYYQTSLEGPIITVATYVRQFAMICVPLFIILTGYLQCGKEITFDKRYVFKLSKVIVPYILITTIIYFVLAFFNLLKGKTLLSMLFGINESGYAWYIEVYIGLYLLIPFINIGWNHIKTKKEKQCLLFTLFFLCCIPNLVKSFNWNFIDYWTAIYPFLFYVTGMYLKEYGLQISNKVKIFFVLISTTISFIMAITIFKTNLFDPCNGYHNPFCFINAMLIFDLLSQINTAKFKEKKKKRLAKIADIVLPAYLGSYVTDVFLYRIFAMTYMHSVEQRLLWAPVFIAISAVCSLTFGKIIAVISNKILNLRRKKI